MSTTGLLFDPTPEVDEQNNIFAGIDFGDPEADETQQQDYTPAASTSDPKGAEEAEGEEDYESTAELFTFVFDFALQRSCAVIAKSKGSGSAYAMTAGERSQFRQRLIPVLQKYAAKDMPPETALVMVAVMIAGGKIFGAYMERQEKAATTTPTGTSTTTTKKRGRPRKNTIK